MTRVSAVLVSHDGGRWLPAVLDGLEAQTRRPDAVVAVDTSSTDGSADVLRTRLGDAAVLTGPELASYAASVSQALAALPAATEDEWVWLLHDDSAPATQALERLLAAAEDSPGVSILGPKLREWPSLRRLLELGVTISGTGRRETGLERGEYDQGQHDRRREVLAVNTAGMLVRRDVLETLGFDQRLPIFGNDLDFGWRAASAGHRTLVVPDAVVFHVEAAHRGARRTALTGSRYHRAERQASLYTLLVDGSLVGLPFRLVRLLLGSLLRLIGFLMVRSPGEAYDELGAVAATYLRPHRIIAARQARRRTARVPHRQVRHLLAPPWLPYRHGLDFVSDVAAAVVNQAADVTAARRERALAETGPVDEEQVSLAPETGVLARLLVSPAAWAFLVLVAVAVAGTRGHLGGGMLAGGALLPAPDSVGHWWSTAFSGWHDIGVGSTAPAAPYLLPLALAGTVLLGKAWLVVDLLLFAAVPLAAWGGYRFLRTVTGSGTASLWGGVAYGLYPVLSGSVQQGRLGTVVVSMVLPFLAHAAVFLVAADSADRRWRAVFRTALWLALAGSFAPVIVLIALVAGVGACLYRRTLAVPVVSTLCVALALLLPWAAATWWHDGVASWLLEAGRPASELIGRVDALDVVFARPGDVGGAPGWLSAGIVVAAVFALTRPDTRRRVLAAWAFVLLGLASTAALSGAHVELAATGSQERVWLGVPMLVAYAAAITATSVAGAGIREGLSGLSFGWRQPVGVVVALVAVVTPLAGLVWWAVTGTDGVIDRRPVTAVPAYMTDEAQRDPGRGVLVVRGSQRDGFRYVLLRQRGLRLGDESVLPSAAEQRGLTTLVGGLASAPTADTVAGLAGTGVGYVYAPRPVDTRLAGNLDSVTGMEAANFLAGGARVWRVDESPRVAPDHGGALHPWLVGLECLGAVVAAVFAAPTRRRAQP